MLFLASTLANLPVITPDRENLGLVKEAVFDPKILKLVGILVQRGIFQPLGVVSPLDVIKISPRFLLVKEREAVLPINEIVRVEKLLKERSRIIRMRAETISGKFLGRVDDILFDETDGRIVKFYLHALMTERILPVESLLKVEKKRLIFNIEESEKQKISAPLPAIE